MKRLYLSLISLLLMVSIVLTNVVGVSASPSDDFKTFSQLDERWSGYVYSGGYTLGQTGCLITAVSILMAYANPDLQDVGSWNPQIASQKFSFDDGSLYWGTVSNSDSTFKFNGKVHSGDKLSESEAKSIVKAELDKGNYVVLCTYGMYTSNTHYSPVVGWDGNKPLVWDVAGGKNSSWEAWSSQGITEICSFSSSKNKSLDVLENGKAGGDNKKEPTEEEIVEIDKLIKENDLVGMPDDFQFGASVVLPDGSMLSDSEKENVAVIKGTVEEDNKFWFNMLFVIVTLIGLLLIIYGVLLGVAYLFDRSNNVLEISLLKVLTLGKYQISYDEGGIVNRDKVLCNSSFLIKRIVVIELVGFFLVSGVFFNVIVDMIYYIMDKF